jgi:hypothetical protein
LINFAALTVLGIALDNIIVVVQNIAMAVGAGTPCCWRAEPTKGGDRRAHERGRAGLRGNMIFAARHAERWLGLFITLSMITTTVAAFALVPGTKMK